MAEVFDILLNTEFDCTINAGDFATGESTLQHQKCLLVASPGNYLQNPAVGVDLYGNINNDEAVEAIRKTINQQFEADGMTVVSLTLNGREVDVKANY